MHSSHYEERKILGDSRILIPLLTCHRIDRVRNGSKDDENDAIWELKHHWERMPRGRKKTSFSSAKMSKEAISRFAEGS